MPSKPIVDRKFMSTKQAPKMGLAHFTHQEIKEMVDLQGEEIIDAATNLPSFPKLSTIFASKAMREFLLDLRDEFAETGGLSGVFGKLLKTKIKNEPEPMIPTPKSVIAKKIKKLGIGKDTQIALVPFDVLDFFDELIGEPEINPKDGLPMYWVQFIPLAMSAASMAMSAMGDKDKGKQQDRNFERNRSEQIEENQRVQGLNEREREKYNEEMRRRYLEEKAENAAERETAGMNKRFTSADSAVNNYRLQSLRDPLAEVNSVKQVRSPYAKGGVVGTPIKGPGKGQDDLINCDTTQEDDWIVDATTVSYLGDGATDAGHKEVRKLENVVKEMPEFKEIAKRLPDGRQVKTALSNGEDKIPRKIVAVLGEGSPKKGADILRAMTEKIRVYKNSNHDKLPPAIGDPLRFLKEAAAQVNGRDAPCRIN